MAADVKLLPLPELPRQVEGYNSDYWEAGQIEEYAADYARANVAHATAALQAEVEALRAEVAAWRELSDRMEAVLDQLQAEIERLRAEVEGWKEQHARDSAELRRICQHRDEYKARAELLAEALEDIRSRSSMNLAMQPDPFELTARLGDIYQIADANSND